MCLRTCICIQVCLGSLGQNDRGHHFVWQAVCCLRGFVRALGLRVTLRTIFVGSEGRGDLGLRRALRHTACRPLLFSPCMCLYVYEYVYVYVDVDEGVDVYVRCMRLCIYIHLCTFLCTLIGTFICICIYIYITYTCRCYVHTMHV